MTRYKMVIEYDGRGFVGWQRQDNGLGAQQVVEEAIKKFCGEDALVQGAGRTDSGVHALGQVAHVDIEKETDADRVRDAINFHARPHAISVLSAEQVNDGFHARFSAINRSYLYRISNRRPPLTIDQGLSWWVPVPLDAEAMHEAAQRLIGKHDFTSFRASVCQAKSPVKTLNVLEVTRAGGPAGEEIHVIASARSFMHHQVRNMVGTLRRVGEGKWTADDITAILEACDRTKGGETAPADGLYLTGVGY